MPLVFCFALGVLRSYSNVPNDSCFKIRGNKKGRSVEKREYHGGCGIESFQAGNEAICRLPQVRTRGRTIIDKRTGQYEQGVVHIDCIT